MPRICQVNLFQPVLLDHGIAESRHGGVLAAMTVAEAVGSARPQRLSRRLSPVAWESGLGLALAAILAGLTFSGPWTVVVLLCLFAAAAGLVHPAQRKLVGDAAPAHAPRATFLSVESIVDRAVCALAAVAVGRLPLRRTPVRAAPVQRARYRGAVRRLPSGRTEERFDGASRTEVVVRVDGLTPAGK
ncbi:hypothetical protein [Streptomyces albus]|uniref:hypothetical protein n=1 Tax=Streptomyces albus TaxID=1888 RepID=UPI003455CD9D